MLLNSVYVHTHAFLNLSYSQYLDGIIIFLRNLLLKKKKKKKVYSMSFADV